MTQNVLVPVQPSVSSAPRCRQGAVTWPGPDFSGVVTGEGGQAALRLLDAPMVTFPDDTARGWQGRGRPLQPCRQVPGLRPRPPQKQEGGGTWRFAQPWSLSSCPCGRGRPGTWACGNVRAAAGPRFARCLRGGGSRPGLQEGTVRQATSRTPTGGDTWRSPHVPPGARSVPGASPRVPVAPVCDGHARPELAPWRREVSEKLEPASVSHPTRPSGRASGCPRGLASVPSRRRVRARLSPGFGLLLVPSALCSGPPRRQCPRVFYRHVSPACSYFWRQGGSRFAVTVKVAGRVRWLSHGPWGLGWQHTCPHGAGRVLVTPPPAPPSGAAPSVPAASAGSTGRTVRAPSGVSGRERWPVTVWPLPWASASAQPEAFCRRRERPVSRRRGAAFVHVTFPPRPEP